MLTICFTLECVALYVNETILRRAVRLILEKLYMYVQVIPFFVILYSVTGHKSECF